MPATKSTSTQRFAGIPLKLYASAFSVEGLQFGIDNLRYDVYFSPGFIKAARRMAIQLFGKFSTVTDLPGFESSFNWFRGEDEFKGLCRDLMMDAVKRAKLDNQHRVQYLAMAAVAAVFREAVEDRHKACIQYLNNQIWRQEMAYNHERVKELRDGLQNITRNRETLVQYANRSLFQYLAEAQKETINDLHKLLFGPVGLLPDDFLANPLLHAENPTAEAFMMGEYILLGSRREDVNQYEALQAALGEFLAGLGGKASRRIDPEQAPETEPDGSVPSTGPTGNATEPADWIKYEGNVDALFNFQRTEQTMRRSRRQSAEKKRVRKLKQLVRRQKRLLVRLLRDFNARGLLRIIVATEVMKAYGDIYCPPLTPHEVLSYIVDPKARKPVKIKLKRIRKNYGEDFTLQPLRSAIGQVRWMPRVKRMEILLDLADRAAQGLEGEILSVVLADAFELDPDGLARLGIDDVAEYFMGCQRGAVDIAVGLHDLGGDDDAQQPPGVEIPEQAHQQLFLPPDQLLEFAHAILFGRLAAAAPHRLLGTLEIEEGIHVAFVFDPVGRLRLLIGRTGRGLAGVRFGLGHLLRVDRRAGLAGQSGQKFPQSRLEGLVLVDVLAPAAEEDVFAHHKSLGGGVLGMQQRVGQEVVR